ncbi:MAG: FHA domain-containing protein, partial [Myxococcaceae bacterium]
MHHLRPTHETMSVKQLKLLAKGGSCEQLEQIIGQFVLVRRPPEQVMKRRLMDLEMGKTRPTRRLSTNSESLALEFLLDFEDLEVLPAPTGREAWKVGRAPEVDVVLDHPSVSKAHAT